MTNKHTPAPWRYNDEQVEAFESTGNRSLQVLVGCSPEDKDANAHLISAASELLAEMESLAKALEDVHELPQSFYDAIKKARGE